MDYLNVEIQASEFNWDDIECGNHDLDHSQNFFAQKHVKHENLVDMSGEDLINEMASATLDDVLHDAELVSEDKENMGSSSPYVNDVCIKQEILTVVGENGFQKQPLKALTERENNASPTNTKAICPKKEANLTCLEEKPKCINFTNENAQDGKPSSTLNVTVKPSKPPSNIACQWSTQKPLVSKYRTLSQSTGTVPKSTKILAPSQTPNAYQFKDVYQRKKEEALRKRDEEDRKKREFHSHPVPDYRACHEQLQRRRVVHAVTCPVTPMVLKKSRETDEKRRKKLEEYKHQQQPPKFEQRPPTYLKKEPFVPKKTSTVVIQRPFKLMSEQRLQERKQFDEATQRTLEEKRKQVEIKAYSESILSKPVVKCIGRRSRCGRFASLSSSTEVNINKVKEMVTDVPL